MVNSVESKLGIINSIIDSSDQLLGDFRGVKVTAKNSSRFFQEINDQVSAMRQLMTDSYQSIKKDLKNQSITGTPTQLQELSGKLKNLKEQMLRMDGVMTKAELSKAKIDSILKIVMANDLELEGLWKMEKKMVYRLTQLMNAKEEAIGGGWQGNIRKSAYEKAPLMPNELKILKNDIEAHRREIARAHDREDEIENLEEQSSKDIQKEIEGFKKLL